MAVQFNLLPDVKLELDRQQRTKRFIYSVSFFASAAAVVLVIISFFAVNILQKKLLNDANNDINKYSQQLKSIPNLDKVLTIQNQLNSLPKLHQQKHYASRLFAYLPQLTPSKINIGKLTIDTTANSIDINGTADTVETINKFVDTLKFTTYKTSTAEIKKQAFKNVVLTKVNRDDKGASYTIDAGFDSALFSNSEGVTLVVPQETTTRSVINTPDATSPLFNGQTQTQTESQKQGVQ